MSDFNFEEYKSGLIIVIAKSKTLEELTTNLEKCAKLLQEYVKKKTENED